MATEDDHLSLDSIFTEPPKPPSPKPTVEVYTREQAVIKNAEDWATIEIALVGSHPLWGHYLWNAARSFASYLDNRPDLYRDRCVLELGAGGGLPGLVTAKNGARTVVLTDYPDTSLLRNLQSNVDQNIPEQNRDRIYVEGYVWGKPVKPLLEILPQGSRAFDLIILSDLVFNHSQHDALLTTCEQAIASSPLTPTISAPCLLVFYSHHRPHLADRDLDFFAKARGRGWHCEEIVTEKFPPMFPQDPGDVEIRSTVHGWMLTRR